MADEPSPTPSSAQPLPGAPEGKPKKETAKVPSGPASQAKMKAVPPRTAPAPAPGPASQSKMKAAPPSPPSQPQMKAAAPVSQSKMKAIPASAPGGASAGKSPPSQARMPAVIPTAEAIPDRPKTPETRVRRRVDSVPPPKGLGLQ